MKTITILSVSLFMIFISTSYAASEQYGSADPILCSVNQVNECVAWQGCEEIEPGEANIPKFIEIDLASKTISGGTTLDVGRKSKIERIETINELLTLSGSEPRTKEGKDKFGWIMTISTDNGQMIISANTNRSALVIFGSCINKSQ